MPLENCAKPRFSPFFVIMEAGYLIRKISSSESEKGQ